MIFETSRIAADPLMTLFDPPRTTRLLGLFLSSKIQCAAVMTHELEMSLLT